MTGYDARHKRYYEKHREECKVRSRDYYRKMRDDPECRRKRKAYKRKRREQLRQQLFAVYGRQCSCPGCSEKNEKFLTLSHKNDDGRTDRATVSFDQDMMLKKAISEADHSKYEILCMNCNAARQWYGRCPHLD